jgi:hemerythrin-like domain-containing protein
MTAIIGLLREEHKNIEKLLRILEQELSIFQRGERPDYDILLAIIRYFQAYPDLCHHPKEDIVFEALKRRDPALADSIADIEDEHQNEAARLRRFALIVESIQVDHEVLRQTFSGAIRDFIDYQRKHIEKEERGLFPAALKALLPEDWAAIDARLSCGKDPLFNSTVEAEYRDLHQRILQWEDENEAERG